jgi:hypothetical protein
MRPPVLRMDGFDALEIVLKTNLHRGIQPGL